MNVIVSGEKYPLIAAQPDGASADWQYRNMYRLLIKMAIEDAKRLFVDNAAWGIIYNGSSEVMDYSDYCVAGVLTDFRDGSVSVLMGQKTEEEKQSQEAERVLPIMQKVLSNLGDDDAIQVADYYEEWVKNKAYAVDVIVRDPQYGEGNDIFRCRQAHTSQEIYPPHTVPALWRRIPKPGEGTKDNPIPYDASVGMELTKDLYYTEDDVLYLCFRDTGIPVYNRLADLVNIYVTIVES